MRETKSNGLVVIHPRTAHLSKKRWRCFTIIELMVVIGIILILVSMLLPALSKARDTAKRIACQSNLKQFHNATMLYSLDHDGWLGGNSSYWYQPARPGYFLHYLGGEPPDSGWCGEKVYDIMTCPANPIKWRWASEFSYAKNTMLTIKISTSHIARNSYRIGMFSDANFFRITHDYEAEPRHRGGVNINFIDGHVDYRRGYGVIDDDIAWYYDFETGEPRAGHESRGFAADFNL